ncbi:MAG: T9SS type A sorting domain-containing protein [Bacteroidales bacterium]|jgi:hypothetical protein
MNHQWYSKCLIFLLILYAGFSYGQYPPPPGYTGTTAIYKDSSVYYAWATHCTVIRGFINIADTNATYDGSNRASFGDSTMATGIADEQVVSLGDGGSATLTFDTIISDHDGWDFAVFENGFADNYLELGFVEVSSDGVHFVRFPSVSLTQTQIQIGAFDTLDTRKIYNLAGKYRIDYGTPFDLAQLKDSAGIDIHHITHIRVVDVVGCIQDAYARYDSQNHKINDPWPTPFNTGGFDLDAVGLVHNAPLSINDNLHVPQVSILPNPCSKQARFFAGTASLLQYQITDQMGQVVRQSSFSVSTSVNIENLPAGIYFVTFTNPVSFLQLTKKLIKY